VDSSPVKKDYVPELWQTLSPYLGIAQAFVALIYVISGGPHISWPLILSLFGIQILTNTLLAGRIRRVQHFLWFSYLLGLLNWLICVLVVILTGGFPSLFWILFFLGAVQSGLFLGRVGAGLNAFFAGVALTLPVLLRGQLTAESAAIILLLGMVLLALGLITAKATAMMLNERQKILLAEEALRQTNVKLSVALAEQSEQSRESALLTEMTDLLQACPVIEETFAVISHYVRRLFPLPNGMLFLYDPADDLLKTAFGWGEPDGAGVPAPFAPAQCWALRNGQIHWQDDPSSGLRCAHLEHSPAGQYVCVPLITQGEIIGVLHLYSPQRDSGAGAELVKELARIISTVKTAGEQISLAIANLRLRELLRQQSIRDPLTGLFNRRYLEETLEREIHRVRREGLPISLIFMDIDHFKTYNDTHGHEAGDTVLRSLGSFLVSQIRYEDIPCRYGGEEFVIVLPDAPLEVARVRAESIREGVKTLPIRGVDQALPPVTLSLGVATIPGCEPNGMALLRAADAALYQAKDGGRDKVVVARPAP
jgi:diguanylate cyclase (GGDEF)-like protein